MRCFVFVVFSIGFVFLLLVVLQVVGWVQFVEEEFVLCLEVEEVGVFNVFVLIDLEINVVKLLVWVLLQAFSVKVSFDILLQEFSGFYLQEDNFYWFFFFEKFLFVFDILFWLEVFVFIMYSDGSCYLGLEYWGCVFWLFIIFDLQVLMVIMKLEVELLIICNIWLVEKCNRVGEGKKMEGLLLDIVFFRYCYWLRGGSVDY